MTFAALGWIIAGFGLPVMAWLLLYFIRAATLLRSKNEDLQKSIDALKRQAGVAARPPLTARDIVDRMRDDR